MGRAGRAGDEDALFVLIEELPPVSATFALEDEVGGARATRSVGEGEKKSVSFLFVGLPVALDVIGAMDKKTRGLQVYCFGNRHVTISNSELTPTGGSTATSKCM